MGGCGAAGNSRRRTIRDAISKTLAVVIAGTLGLFLSVASLVSTPSRHTHAAPVPSVVTNEATASLPIAKILRGDFKHDVTSLSISDDGATIAAASHDEHSGIRLWDVSTGRLVRIKATWANTIALSPNGFLLAGTGDDVALWDLRTGRMRLLAPHDAYDALAFSPDGQFVVGTSLIGIAPPNSLGLGRTTVWNAATATARWTLPEGANALALAPDGRTVAVSTAKAWTKVRVIDMLRGVIRQTLDADSVVESLAYSPDGEWLAASGRKRQGVTVVITVIWNLRTGSLQSGPPANVDNAVRLIFSRDGHTLIIADLESPAISRIRFWDVAASTVRHTVTVHGRIGALAFSKRRNVLVGAVNNDVVLWDVSKLIGANKPILTSFQNTFSASERKVIDAAMSMVVKNWAKAHISALSVECVTFFPATRAGLNRAQIDVHEIHNARCGGDPLTAPRVTTLTIQLASGKVAYEALVNGEFKDIPLN